jgi:hypothetical protein
MSIDALIQAHTEALLANTEAVKLLTLSLAGRTPTAANKAADAVEKPKADPKPVANKEEPKVEFVVTDENGDAILEDGGDKPNLVPYETVRALVLKLAPTQRDAIKALNVKHGIANLKVLLDKEDDFNTVNDQAKLEAVYADLQALEA